MRKKNKLGRQKKFLMLTSILSIVLLMSTSMAAAAISRSVADSITSESAESSSSDEKENNPSYPAHLPNRAPIANFSFTKEAGSLYSYIFDGSTSYDPDGVIVSYSWSYTTDGSTLPVMIGDGSIINYTFDQPGNYLVSLKVTDNKGATDIMNKLVMIPDGPPVIVKVDQSASTELTATSENKVASNQQQASPSQQLFNRILNTRSPLGNSQAFALIIFRKGRSNATIDDITYIGNKATMELTINEGVMNFRFLGGSATVSAGEQVTIGMFRGLFTKEPKNGNPAAAGEWITSMIGFGWYST